MENINIASIFSVIGTSIILFIYIHLYNLYRERYIGFWICCWFFMLIRYIIFDSNLWEWRTSAVGLIFYHLLITMSLFLFAIGSYKFINKAIPKWFVFGVWGMATVSAVAINCNADLYNQMILPTWLWCFMAIYLSIIFIQNAKEFGVGRLITGFAFILWCATAFLLPFGLKVLWMARFGYASGGLFRLCIAIGTLTSYFKKNRMDLLNKEKIYRLLAENAVDAIYSVQISPNIQIRYISPAIYKITGYTAEEYYENKNLISGLIHPEDQEMVSQYFYDYSKIKNILTFRLIAKNNNIVWVEQTCVIIYDEYKKITEVQGIIRDITQKKKLEHISANLDRMNVVGNMAATVAHEIRNPMTTVHGYLQMMQQKERYISDKEKFKLMLGELDRANKIIGEYLSLSREKRAILKKCSLNQIIESVFPLLQADAVRRKVDIKLKLMEIPNLIIDENEIRQMLHNIVRNGIEAMQSGGDLMIETMIETMKEENKVILSIQDQGPGIPQNIIDRIGTPFITTKENGTGLGLSICYQIANRNGAEIKVKSSAEGTKFFICFQ